MVHADDEPVAEEWDLCSAAALAGEHVKSRDDRNRFSVTPTGEPLPPLTKARGFRGENEKRTQKTDDARGPESARPRLFLSRRYSSTRSRHPDDGGAALWCARVLCSTSKSFGVRHAENDETRARTNAAVLSRASRRGREAAVTRALPAAAALLSHSPVGRRPPPPPPPPRSFAVVTV